MRGSKRRRFVGVAAGCALFACGPAEGAVRFVEVSNDSFPAGFSVQTKEVESVDIDGDGDIDLLLAQENGPNWLLLNDGQARFTKSGDVLAGRFGDTEALAVSDSDRDGDLDVLFVNEDDRAEEFYRNDGGNLSPASFELPAGGVSNAVIPLDLNGDGWEDFLIGNADGLAVWINETGLGFRYASSQFVSGSPGGIQDIAAADVDADGDLDLAVVGEGDNVILLNDGDGRLAPSPQALPVESRGAQSRASDFADVDGDGDLDLFLSNVAFGGRGDPRDLLLINDGNGRFALAPDGQIFEGLAPIYTMESDFADIDGDGDPDLLSVGLLIDGGLAPAAVRIGINDGYGRFVDAAVAMFGSPIEIVGTDVAAADYNGDGLIDLYIANRAGPDRLFLQVQER